MTYNGFQKELSRFAKGIGNILQSLVNIVYFILVIYCEFWVADYTIVYNYHYRFII